MAATPSTMLPLGTQAPAFTLPDTDGATVSYDDVAGSHGTAVFFICNHCPFVKHVQAELTRFAHDYLSRGIGVVAISSNDVDGYPADSPAKMVEEKAKAGYPFPYLYDESQEVAKAYAAACTPDYYLFDGAGKLVYRGQLDASRPGNGIPVTGEDLRAATDAVLGGQAPAADQTPSIGCNIKWKPGNAPSYFG
ncbi:MAG: thioredoxin family protein [Acidobacteriota bacterium]